MSQNFSRSANNPKPTYEIKPFSSQEDFDARLKRAVGLDFNIHESRLMREYPFYSFFSSVVRKYFVHGKSGIAIDTCGVTFEDGNFQMYINPFFMKECLEDANPKWILGVFIHEYLHIINGHLDVRSPLDWKTMSQEDRTLHNIAMDLSINCLIDRELLSDSTMIPGERPYTAGQASVLDPIYDVIKTLPKYLSYEEYYRLLKKNQDVQKALQQMAESGMSSEIEISIESDGDKEEKEEGKENKGGRKDSKDRYTIGSVGSGERKVSIKIDSHDLWNNLSESEKEIVKEFAMSFTERAIQEADNRENGWGNIPIHISNMLRKIVSKTIPWNHLLRLIMGRFNKINKKYTWSKHNKKYEIPIADSRLPFKAGPRKNTGPLFCISVDQSGSVCDDDISRFIDEINRMLKKGDIWYVPFDHDVNPDDVVKYKKGQKILPERSKAGGTSFDAPIKYAHENIKQIDAIILLTDGACVKPQPTKTYIPIVWVVSPGSRLNFTPDPRDKVIYMNKLSN